MPRKKIKVNKKVAEKIKKREKKKGTPIPSKKTIKRRVITEKIAKTPFRRGIPKM